MTTLRQGTQLKYSLSILPVAYWTERLVPHNPGRMAVNCMRCAEKK